MSKIAFIFPGQGAQTCGMGKDFYEQTETGRKVFDKATELLGFSVPELCFEPNDRLDITEYTQAAMVTTSIAMMKVLEENGVKPDVAAGLSLGEYCALAAAGVMSEEDSGMLVGAGEKLGKVLENVEIHKPVIPYAANVTAQYVTEAEPVKDLLVKQVSSSVKWQQCVETMLADGVDTFIEIGPGKTLAGFMRKIDRSVKTLNVEKLEDIEKVVEALKEA